MKKTLAILLALVMALSAFGVAAYADALAGYYELPTVDSDDLPPGAFWYDKAAYVADQMDWLNENFDPESETYQNLAQQFEDTEFYLSIDATKLARVIYDRITVVDLTDPDDENIWIAYNLKQKAGAASIFYQLPFADNDDLNDGDYWFDLDGFIAWGLQDGMPSEYADLYGSASFYIKADAVSVDTIYLIGENGFTQTWTEGDFPEAFRFLHRHGADGFSPLPTEDSNFLNDGDYWLDLENLLGYWVEESIKPVMFLADYADADYFINGSASVIRIVFGEDDYEDYFSAENTDGIFDFLRRHGADGFSPLPKEDGNDLNEGDYYLYWGSWSAWLMENGIISAAESTQYYFADYYINADATVIRIVFQSSRSEEHYADNDAYRIFDYVYRHGECRHEFTIPVPTAFPGCGREYLILDNVADPAYLNYTYYWCYDCYRVLVYDGETLVTALTYDELEDYGIDYAWSNGHTDENEDGICEVCGAYRLTEEVSVERYYLVIPEEHRSLPFFSHVSVWGREEDGETVFDVFYFYDGESWLMDPEEMDGEELRDYERAIGWITAPAATVCEHANAAPVYDTPTHEGWYLVAEEAGVDVASFGIAYYCPDCEQLLNGDYNEVDTGEYIVRAVLNEDHIFDETITANVTVKAATCTENGSKTVKCAICEETQTKKTDDKLGHDFTATWVWTEDGSKATLTLTCTRGDKTETLTAEGDAIAYSEAAATETAEGEGTYTASIVYEGETYTDEYKVTLPVIETPTDPTEPTEPTEPAADEPQTESLCKWCGKDHSGSFWQKIIGFFHSILYFFAHLFGRK